MFMYAIICAVNFVCAFAYDMGIMDTIYVWSVSFGSVKDVIVYAGFELAILTAIACSVAQIYAIRATKDLRKESKLLNALMWIV